MQLEDEPDQDRHDQSVNTDGLGERDSEDHVGLNGGRGVRVAAHCLQSAVGRRPLLEEFKQLIIRKSNNKLYSLSLSILIVIQSKHCYIIC